MAIPRGVIVWRTYFAEVVGMFFCIERQGHDAEAAAASDDGMRIV